MLTLDNLEDIESLHRTDFYKLITGVEEIPFGVATTAIDPFRNRVTYENMNQFMQAINLFEKRHGGEYYQGDIEKAKLAYKRKDLDAFQDALGEILVDIVND